MPLGHSGAQAESTHREIVAGLVVHQSADILWAVRFFGLGARVSWRLRPAQLLAAVPFWALATEAAEYHVILPPLQPIRLMQTPFWVGLPVHLASGAAYPLFHLGRRFMAGAQAAPHERCGRRTAGALAGVLLLLGAGEALCGPRLEPRAGARRLRGQRLRPVVPTDNGPAPSGRSRAGPARGRPRGGGGPPDAGRMMVAEQQAEVGAQHRWWRGWFGGELPPPSPAELAGMPGMPPAGAIAELRTMQGAEFGRRFLPVMTLHQEGAIQMAEGARRRAAESRLRLFADQIRHAQVLQADPPPLHATAPRSPGNPIGPMRRSPR